MKELVEQWAANFWKFTPKEMTEEFTMAYITLATAEVENRDVLTHYPPHTMIKLLRLRGASVGIDFSSSAIVLVGMLCQGRPANATMYCNALAFRMGDEQLVTMDTIMRFFPDGFPDNEWLMQAWNKQKGHYLGIDVPLDNLLDAVLS
jgi:hypothetical protein